MRLETRLVFVDGIVGAGKSRLAQWLWLHLRRCGAQAEWFAESLEDHPLHAAGEPSSSDAGDALAQALGRWTAFVNDRLGSPRVTILDATLLQATGGLFEALDLPLRGRREAIAAMLQAAAPLAPVLVYLHPPAGRHAIEHIAALRGEAWCRHMEAAFAGLGGIAEIGAYYGRRLEGDLALIDGLGIPVLQLPRNGDDWRERQVALCRFLGIAQAPNEGEASPGLACLTGRYLDPASGSAWTVEVSEDGCLRFAEGGRARLLHLEGLRFVVEGRPVEAVFTLGEARTATRLSFTQADGDRGPDTEWIHVGG